MENLKYINNLDTKKIKSFTKRHYEITNDLEKMLEKGIPNLTMSQIASNLKISFERISLTQLCSVDDRPREGS